MKKITYVTGSRAEYGVMKALLERLRDSGSFSVSIIATGMHFSRTHGYTLDEVRKGGIPVDAVEVDAEENSPGGMARLLGKEIVGITDVLEHTRPDVVLVAGDRDEALAGALAAAHLGIPVAHVSGGDVTTGATIDEKLRHAITKLADIHFPANEQAAQVVIAMRADPALVFPVGNPGVALQYAIDDDKKNAIKKKYDLATTPTLLVVQHPITSQVTEVPAQMRETLAALKELGLQSVLVYPNADAGSGGMIAAIDAAKDEPYLRIHANIPREDFLVLMSIADAMVGNSSAALIEAPSFSLPTVNIGARQEGRERASNVIDVSHERNAIVAAVRKALSPEFRASLSDISNPYAKEDAEGNIVAILRDLDLRHYD